MRVWFLLPFLALLLIGCASTPTTVDVPLPIGCAPQVAPAKPFVDTKEALQSAPTIEARVRLLLGGRIQRDTRIGELEGALEACKLPVF
jgi:hypothetical protein